MKIDKLGLLFVSAILPTLTFLKFGNSRTFFALFAYAAVSAVLTKEDFMIRKLPNKYIYPASLFTMTFFITYSITERDAGIVGTALTRAFICFSSGVFLFLIARGGFSVGDIKLFVLQGLAMAPFPIGFTLAGLVMAFLGAGLYSVSLVILKRATRKTVIAFGPFMILGSWLAIFYYA